MEVDFHPKLVGECREKAFHEFGFQYIFDKRASKYNKLLNWLKVLGILVPSLIGMTVISYDYKNVKELSIAVLTIVTLIQFGISIFAIIYKWDDELSYSYEASQAHNNLYLRFIKLADFPPSIFDILNHQYSLLITESNGRDQQDTKHNISEKELRKGMRYSLREHKRACVNCKIIPASMKTTSCPVCGDF